MAKKPLTRDEVVTVWMTRGVSDLFFAFELDQQSSRYRPFFLAMGIEMISKAYLLGHQSAKYDGKQYERGMKIVDGLAKTLFGHRLQDIVESICTTSEEQDLQKLLQKSYHPFTGRQLLQALQSAYLESRYPVPNPVHHRFPVKVKGRIRYDDPLNSSGPTQFSHDLCRKVLCYIKKDFAVVLHPDTMHRLRPRAKYCRFRRLFFADVRGLVGRRKRCR